MIDFSIHNAHFKVFLGIVGQNVLGEPPEVNFFPTFFHSTFIALEVTAREPRPIPQMAAQLHPRINLRCL